MTIPTSYDTIILAVQQELENSDGDFVNNIPTAIKLAEDRINRDVDGLFNKYISNPIPLQTGVRTSTKPTGHKLTYMLNISVNGIVTPLIKKAEDYIIDYWPNLTQTGVPKYYSDISKTTIALAPTPDSAYSLTYSYAKNNDYLTPSNQTNPITDFYGDLLYKAVLCEQAKYARMPDAATVYEQDYQTRLGLVSEETRRERQDNTSPRYRTQIDENRKK